MNSRFLTKSRFLNSLQCPKYVWTVFNDPGKIRDRSETERAVFSQGYLFEDQAKRLFPESIDLSNDDFIKNINDTREGIKSRKTLFEAGITAGELFARADILDPSGNHGWNILEIKSAASVKDVHIDDIAFQKYCFLKAGLKIEKCFLLYVNSKYVRHGEIEPSLLVIKEDVTERTDRRLDTIPADIEKAFAAVRQNSCPEPGIGEYCHSPYECPLVCDCWSFLPEKESVFALHRGGKLSWKLYREGIYSLKDIPADSVLSGFQEIQRQCSKEGKPHIDKKAIDDFLSDLKYPLQFLDFETFGPAVPLFDNARPYRNIPFQYSLHIVDSPGKKPEHFSFLYDKDDDPRLPFLLSLLNDIRPQGSIIVYNESFEKMVLNQLAELFPVHEKKISEITGRIRDLYLPFKSFHYYSPLQQGSASLKKVLPALTGKDYSALDIADGSTASVRFYELYHEKRFTGKEAEKIRRDLEKYCGLDSEGMILILDKLKNLPNRIF